MRVESEASPNQQTIADPTKRPQLCSSPLQLERTLPPCVQGGERHILLDATLHLLVITVQCAVQHRSRKPVMSMESAKSAPSNQTISQSTSQRANQPVSARARGARTRSTPQVPAISQSANQPVSPRKCGTQRPHPLDATSASNQTISQSTNQSVSSGMRTRRPPRSTPQCQQSDNQPINQSEHALAHAPHPARCHSASNQTISQSTSQHMMVRYGEVWRDMEVVPKTTSHFRRCFFRFQFRSFTFPVLQRRWTRRPLG